MTAQSAIELLGKHIPEPGSGWKSRSVQWNIKQHWLLRPYWWSYPELNERKYPSSHSYNKPSVGLHVVMLV